MKPPSLWVTGVLAVLYLIQFARIGREGLVTDSRTLERVLNVWTFIAFAPILLASLNPELIPSIRPAVVATRLYFVQIVIVILCLSEAFLKLGQLLDIKGLLRVISISDNVAELNQAASQLVRYRAHDFALEAHQKIIKLDPQSASAHEQLAFLYGVMRRFAEAEGPARKAIALKPDMAYAHYYLALSLHEQGKSDLAEQSFCKAIELGLSNNLSANVRRFLSNQSVNRNV